MYRRMAVVAIVGALLAATLRAQTPKSVPAAIPAPVSLSAGRWQVVNGTPENRNTIMLLDTATGATFILCNERPSTLEPAGAWCGMNMYAAAAPPPGHESKP